MALDSTVKPSDEGEAVGEAFQSIQRARVWLKGKFTTTPGWSRAQAASYPNIFETALYSKGQH